MRYTPTNHKWPIRHVLIKIKSPKRTTLPSILLSPTFNKMASALTSFNQQTNVENICFFFHFCSSTGTAIASSHNQSVIPGASCASVIRIKVPQVMSEIGIHNRISFIANRMVNWPPLAFSQFITRIIYLNLFTF